MLFDRQRIVHKCYLEKQLTLACILVAQTLCPHIVTVIGLAPVVQMMDSTMQWINHYPLNNSIDFASVCPLDSDLSGG